MRILVVDDEALARKRLCTLLAELDARHQAVQAAHAGEALALLTQPPAFDLVLLDIHMPGQDGLALAHQIARLAEPPAIVFVTAHAEHAVCAFELDAADYLTKPVRRERLQQALAKAGRRHRPATPAPSSDGPALLVQDQGRTERVPLAEVLYIRAELKYLTLRTATRSYVIDGALTELHQRHPQELVRIHRNTLIARHALRALERHPELEEGDGWAVRLRGSTELLPVSRRQVAAVREILTREA
ncbi:LytTR family DNA-binding domain-containing protein [Comamonas sp. NLF-1-9]|uniref:LytR/AlgR family response regulator transcription factor n=1 Tax=Comamonas sp. NLF-1-9 TaxID=2853163 RepID=UPI001C44746D|nr:LytTR family DNA-binding domain-containing protein [Comamonas sp. NLF-1-9]QXL84486.1 LytTR family DNA-binding domain-containing protein [Comamonas sp. NLF-1-9]